MNGFLLAYILCTFHTLEYYFAVLGQLGGSTRLPTVMRVVCGMHLGMSSTVRYHTWVSRTIYSNTVTIKGTMWLLKAHCDF